MFPLFDKFVGHYVADSKCVSHSLPGISIRFAPAHRIEWRSVQQSQFRFFFVAKRTKQVDAESKCSDRFGNVFFVSAILFHFESPTKNPAGAGFVFRMGRPRHRRLMTEGAVLFEDWTQSCRRLQSGSGLCCREDASGRRRSRW